MIPPRQQTKDGITKSNVIDSKLTARLLTNADRVLVRWELFSQPAISSSPVPVFGFDASTKLFNWASADINRLKRIIRILRKRTKAYRLAGFRGCCSEKACHDLLSHISDFI